jgi:hypothetical protein
MGREIADQMENIRNALNSKVTPDKEKPRLAAEYFKLMRLRNSLGLDVGKKAGQYIQAFEGAGLLPVAQDISQAVEKLGGA